MKLRRFKIDGFKALAGLDIGMPMDSLFLIGVNGAGKSSVLQALSFVRHFAVGRALEFFEERGWQVNDTRPRIGLRTLRSGDRVLRMMSSKNLHISLLLSHGKTDIFWEFAWGYQGSTPVFEALWVREDKSSSPRQVINVSRPSRPVPGDGPDTIRLEDLKLGGSVLSALSPERLAHGDDADHLSAVTNWSQGITSLELLSPIAMRRGVRGKPKDIGPRGERLAGFIAALSATKRDELVSRVSQFYPLANLDAVKKTAGWIDMRLLERYPDMARISPAHMSDGFMRILALCAIPEFDDSVSLVLLDQVEDGIEPHILPSLIQFVSEASSCQFVMTSHSPLLVNYFSSDQVSLLTRREDGRTAVARPDEMDMFLRGSEYFGVGEIWVNTSSSQVSAAIADSSDRKGNNATQRRSDVDRVIAFMDGI